MLAGLLTLPSGPDDYNRAIINLRAPVSTSVTLGHGSPGGRESDPGR